MGHGDLRGKTLGAIAAAALAAGVGATPVAAAPPEPAFDWYGLGGCTVPVVGMPTDFANVAPFIPDDQESRVINVGADGSRQAGLIFVFIGCPDNRIEKSTGNVPHGPVVQVMTGVLYQSGRQEDADKAQFYLLSSAIDWQPFVLAENGIGVPGQFVPATDLNVVRDPASGLGSFEATVPGGSTPFTAVGQILAPNPNREFPQDAVHFFKGPQGLVRVHHDESWAAGNEAVGTIVAPAGSPVAIWMGATAREAVGVYVWINDVLHIHRYRVVE